MERRHSTTSDSSTDSSHTRQYYNMWSGIRKGSAARRHSSCDNVETPLGRTAKVTTPKPPPNALQFVKTGPADLYRSAQEQLKKVEELKKAKKQIPDEAEDWQSNLDNWKCSRRKRQEHIIERVVEVKKLELEEHERNRRRSKTFNEMIQDRNIRGRKTSLPVYQDDDANDFLELGISSREKDEFKDTSGTDSDEKHAREDDSDKQNSVKDERSTKDANSTNEHSGKSNGFKGSDSDLRVTDNTDTEEYTYERAIQSYVNFAETRVKSRSTRSITEDKPVINGFLKEPPPIPAKTRHFSAPRIENSISQIERKKSISTYELTSDNIKKQHDLPKVDISKRKELFEKNPDSEEISKRPNRTSSELPNSRSIKERLSSLKEYSESPKVQTINKMSTDISVKDRLTSIERFNSNEEKPSPERKSSDQLNSQSIKERLSNLERVINVPSKVQTTIEPTVTIKERLSSLKSACNKEKSEDIVTNDKLSTFQDLGIRQEECYQIQRESYERSFSPEEIYESKRQQHYRHRSLDSLDVDSNSNDAFERVQSLEDLEYCRNYPASTFSGDTDREDSGIHTADVSSSVSQADDYDLHLEANGIIDDIKAHHQPTIVEEMKHFQTDSFSYDESNHPQDVSPVLDFAKSEVEEKPVISASLIDPKPSTSLPIALNKFETNNSISNIDDTMHPTCSLPSNRSNPSSHKIESDLGTNEILCPEKPFTRDEDIELVNTPICNSLNQSLEIENSNFTKTETFATNEDILRKREMKSKQNPEKRRTVVEVCCKIDSSELKSPPVTPFISVDLSSSFIPEKIETTEVCESQEHCGDGEKVTHRDECSEHNLVMNNTYYENEMNVKQTTNPSESKSKIQHDAFDFSEHAVVKNKAISGFNQTSIDSTQSFNQELFIPTEDMQMGELFIHLNMDQEVESVFQLSPTALEPPKEKPPPPPKDMSDDDIERSYPVKSTSLRRLDSTKRIKKEIRQKRSSFLGIDGHSDDSYLDPDLELIRPPDMTALLAEERRMERQMYRQSVCSESDSNQESRDSGVELDNKNQDTGWSHSRNDSETFGNQSTTSEEDEIMRKEREIIETLEQEERIRKQDLGEKLALRLRQLEVEKGREDWERTTQGETLRNHHHMHHPVREHSHAFPQIMDTIPGSGKSECILQDSVKTQNVTPVDDRSTMVKKDCLEIFHCEQERITSEHQHIREPITLEQQWYNTRSSLQDISHSNKSNGCHQETHTAEYPKEYRNSLQDLSEPGRGRNTVSHGQSMPDLHQVVPCRPPPPLPILPPKSRIHHPPTTNESQSCPQQMTRQTLHALSAVPRSRLISNDIWQVKRKPRQDSYNYQHWLIQEAEHRRITEQQQRQSMIPPKPSPPKHSFNQWGHVNRQYTSHPHHPTYTSVPQTQQWNHQHRDSKPLPDSIIQTLTQRVQNRMNVADTNNNRRRYESNHISHDNHQEKMLSVSGKKRCSHCGEELGRGAAMIIESLRLFYHIDCFKCCVCCMQLGDGLMGTDVRVRNNKLHCHNCYSSDDGIKFSCV